MTEIGKGSAKIARICTALRYAYGSPRHGNKDNPLDELIYIILSTRRGRCAIFPHVIREAQEEISFLESCG